MKHAIMIGSNMFIGTNGILTVEINGKNKEFFRVRELYKERSNGSYLAIDCDIKDSNNEREIKLFKSKPVAIDETINIVSSDKVLTANRDNNSTIIKVEQLESSDPSLPQSGPVHKFLAKHPVDAILRITGSFYAGNYYLKIDNSSMKIGTNTIGGNLSVNTGGLFLTPMGFMM